MDRSGFPIHDQAGQWVAEEITERKRYEQELIHARKGVNREKSCFWPT